VTFAVLAVLAISAMAQLPPLSKQVSRPGEASAQKTFLRAVLGPASWLALPSPATRRPDAAGGAQVLRVLAAVDRISALLERVPDVAPTGGQVLCRPLLETGRPFSSRR